MKATILNFLTTTSHDGHISTGHRCGKCRKYHIKNKRYQHEHATLITSHLHNKETKQHARHSLKNKTQNLVTTCQDGRISTICCHQVGAPVRAKV